MNSKILLIILIILFGIIGVLVLKINKSSGANNNEVISLSTIPYPPQLGQNTFIILINDKDGKTINDAKVTFDINMTTMNMGTQQGNTTPQGNGKYSATGRLTMRGPWRFVANVTLPDGSQVKKDFMVNVQ